MSEVGFLADVFHRPLKREKMTLAVQKKPFAKTTENSILINALFAHESTPKAY